MNPHARTVRAAEQKSQRFEQKHAIEMLLRLRANGTNVAVPRQRDARMETTQATSTGVVAVPAAPNLPAECVSRFPLKC